MKLTKNSILSSLVGALLLPASAAGETISLTVATGHPPVIPWVGELDAFYLPEVNRLLEERSSEYSVAWNTAYGGSLAKIGGVLEAIEQGIADAGIVGAVFEPSNLPLQIVSYYAPFVSGDIATVVEILDEMHDEIPEMMNAWMEFDQVYLTGIGVDNFNLFTKEPIQDLADLEGLRIGGAGPNLNWIEGYGATGIQIDLTTVYNDLQTGIYDGVLLFPSSAAAIRVHEVAPHMLQVDFGAMSWAGLTVNRDVWEALPDDVRQAMLDAAEAYRDHLNVVQAQQGVAGLERMVDEGLTVVEVAAERRIAFARELPDVAGEWVQATEAPGRPAAQVLARFIDKARERGAPVPRDWAAHE